MIAYRGLVKIFFIAFLVVFTFQTPSFAKMAQGKISGKLTDLADGSPLAGVLVRAWDEDLGPGQKDQKMGEAITDKNGNYSISFEGKNWDPKLCNNSMKCKRPDVYITALVKLQGKWTNIFRSNTKDDVVMKKGIVMNRKINLGKELLNSDDSCGLQEPLECSAADAKIEELLLKGGIKESVSSFVGHYDRIFKSSCVSHDLCYRHGKSTYCNKRKQCDDKFLADNKRACRKFEKSSSRELCMQAAEIYYDAVRAHGKSSFKQQSQSLYCEYLQPSQYEMCTD